MDEADEGESLVNGEYLGVGDRVGDVIDTGDNIVPVASRHAGWLQGFLVPHGCPVRAAEPICWLSGRSAGKTVSGTENLADLCGEIGPSRGASNFARSARSIRHTRIDW